jgi:glycine dehydrogenase subunit 1
MHHFLPHTDADRRDMLAVIGVEDQEALFADIPASLRENVRFDVLPERGLSEPELQQMLKDWARLNRGQEMACFLGGGAYARFIPPAVQTIAGRSEFYTAYTPYQPEIAQGTLQATYEFQTMISELTGMDAANASVYDGASAVAEAALMALRVTRRSRVRVARTVHPDYRRVLKTYMTPLDELKPKGVEIIEFDPSEWNQAGPESRPDRETACVIVQVPDYFGALPDLAGIRRFCEASGALFVVSAEPVSLGILQPPGAYGADIVIGDIQPLGNALAFGGPYGGYIATRNRYLRQLPGRLAGRAVEKTRETTEGKNGQNGVQAGRIGYTLTLQTREQHIRRETATSNICTNQALNVLKATVYLSLLGPAGLKNLAALSAQRAHALAHRLQQLPGVRLYRPEQPFLFEFALQFPVPVAPLLAALQERGILGGIPLERFYPEARNTLLIACTELTTATDIDRYVTIVTEVLRTTPENESPGIYFTFREEAVQ